MADTKISALTSLTKATIATDDVFPVVDTSTTTTKKISFTELIRPLDSQFRIAGSSDNTKLVAFEVDGLTTATTRTITVPDADLTLVGLTTTQTLTNKTLTSPQLNFGSDATGDMIYRTSGGSTARLAIGTAAMILQVSAAGIPEWAVNPAAADASTTVKGVVEIATSAEITAGTSAGATGAKLVVPADAVGTSASKIVQLDSSARLPAVDGSQLTNIPYPVFKTGKSSRTSATGTGTLDIAHGLGAAPKLFKLSYYYAQTAGSNPADFVTGTGTCTSTSDETCSWLVGVTSAADVNGGTSGQIMHAENTTATETLNVSVSAIDATNVTLSFNTFTGTATVYWQWEAYT